MPKPGKQKKSCDNYKAQGRLEKNKKLKDERNQRRIDKFRKRREAGKSYVYEPIPEEIKNNPRALAEERYQRSIKNVDHRLPYQKWTSLMRKLDNELAEAEKAAKLSAEKEQKRKYVKREREQEDSI
jgi:hypothetical protein